MKKALFILILFSLLITYGLAQDRFLIKVSPATPEEISLLSSSGVRAYTKTADYYLAEATSDNLEFLKSNGISYEVLDEEAEFALYYFVWAKPGEDISGYLDQIMEKATILEAIGEQAIIKGHPRRIEDLTSKGLRLKLIKKRALPIKAEEEFPVLLRGKVTDYNPVINQIMQKVTTNKLYDYVADLTGESEVMIGGVPETLLTRYTYTDDCDKAAQYIKEKFESFGLTAYYDTFNIPTVFPTYIMDIVSTPSGDTAWLGCYYTGVWKTTDAGNSWYNISSMTDLLWSLSAPTPDTLYAVGKDYDYDIGIIIKSVDGGENWTELSSPSSQMFRGVYFENSLRGMVIGNAGIILYTADGGQNWTTQTSGTSSNLYEITYIDSNNGWVVGSEGTILHTTDGGSNWSAQSSGTKETICGIDFATPNKGWACGNYGYLSYTTNAGANWNSQISGTIERLYMVSALDSLEVWAAGIWTILHTTNGGSNWSTQSPINRRGYFFEVYFLDNFKGWITGYDDILYTTDGGQNWVQQMKNIYPQIENYNVIAKLPGQTEPGKECLITAHYDALSTDTDPDSLAPGADDNASGTAAVLISAEILKDYDFEYTLKFIGFSGEEQGLIGSDAYVEEAYQRGDTIIGVYNFDMIAYEGNDINNIRLIAGTGASSQALADITIGVINDYSLSLIPEKITTGTKGGSDHGSFWNYGYPAILGIEDSYSDPNPFYHTSNDLLSTIDLPYFTDFSKAGIASVAILAQPLKSFFYGDANGDGEVTISDVIYIINYLFKGGPAPEPLLSANADCIGEIEVADAIFIINYLFKGGPLPNCRLLNKEIL